jgi:hypothetical protein
MGAAGVSGESFVKVGALLCGLLASAFVWALPYAPASLLPATIFDLYPEFVALWARFSGQAFLGLLVWHGLVATGILGGLLCVLTPAAGTLVLLMGAAGWAFLGLLLPGGFTLPVLIPLGLTAAAALFAFGAAIAAGLRRREARRQRRPSIEELEREDALQAEPEVELRRSAELKGVRAMREVEPLPIEPLRPEEPDEQENVAEADDDLDQRTRPLPVYQAESSGFDDDRRDTRIVERRGSPVLAALNALLLLLLTAAVGILLYSEYRSGALSAAFAFLPPASTVAAVEPVAPAPAAATEAAAQPEPEPAPETQPVQVLAPAQPEVRVSTVPLDFAELSTTTWDDPFAYCTGVGTIDAPDRRYDGPAGVPTIVAALPAAGSAPQWRCFNGSVLACTATAAESCEKTPSIAEMTAYCAANPDARDLGTAGRSWGCRGTRPEIPLGQAWPVDARGFLPGAWSLVAPPAAPVPPAG